MAFLDELKEKTGDVARAGAAKSKQIVEMAKCRIDIMAEQDAIRKAYQQIGKRYYAQHGAAPQDGYADACKTIKQAEATIAAKERRIKVLRGHDGQTQPGRE